MRLVSTIFLLYLVKIFINKSMGNFFSLAYWLDSRPPIMEGLEYSLYLSLILAFLIMAVGFGLAMRYKKSIFKRVFASISTFGWSNLFLGLVYLLFRQEAIPYLSARVLVFLWGIGVLIWLAFIIKKAKKIPELKKAKQEEEVFRKYIP